MKRLFSLTRALVARKRKIFALFFALAASIGMSWATVITWDQSKVSSMAMNVSSGSDSKTSDGITVTAVSTGEVVLFGDGGAIEIGNGEGSGGGYLTFTSSVGNIAQIDINHSGAGEWRNANGDWISPYYENFEGGTFTWSGTPAASITLTGDAPRHIENITSIEFTIEDGGGSTPANACGDGLIWELKNGELTISYTGTGTGVMDNYASASDAPWYSYKDDITSVTITDGVKSVGSYSFGYYGNLVTVTIGNDVETIGEYAFGDCYKFTTLNLGNSVKHIGNRAFMWAKVLTGFTLPSTLETIGDRAFLQNKLITSLTIPSSVTSIGQSAFMYCAALTSITVEATTPPTLKETVFDGVPTSIPLNVPNGSVAAYTAADQWNAFNIQGYDPAPGGGSTPANVCGDGLTWELSEGVLTISYDGEGTGEMTDFGYENDQNPVNVAPWKENKSEITTVIVGDGVKSIGNYAFNDLSENFTAVTIANSVERIGVFAFTNSEEITEITLPSSLKTIDDQGFANCGFTSITIPSGVTSIGYRAFSWCRNLTSLTCEATTPPTLASGVFYKISNTSSIPLYVPSESVAAYTAANQWNAFDIQGYDPAPGGGSTPTITWNSSNISDLIVFSISESYSKEGVTLSGNADKIEAYWYGSDENNSGISFHANATGGFTFSNTLGKNFTKIEMTLNVLGGWNYANLGSGWNIDGMKAIWTGNASTVDLLKDESGFNSTPVNSIVFYFEGDSEGGGSTANLKLIEFQAPASWENDNSPITSADFPGFVATTYEIASALPINSDEPSLVFFDFPENDEVTVYTKMGEQVKEPSTGTIVRSAIFENAQAHYYYPVLAGSATPAYETVMNLINEIPNPAVLTAECKAKIDAARAAFIALSDGDKAQVTNYETLTTAEAAFDNVMDIWLSGDCDAILWKDTTLTIRKHAGEGNGAMADYTDYYGDNTAPWFNSHWYDPKPNDIVIKSVKIEEGVTRIGDYAFGWMSELKTLTIPSSVTSIGEDAFYWSKAVDDIYLTVANPSNLTWVLPYSADNQFKPEKATRCHVPADLLTAYQETFGTLNMTFVGDLDPITPLTPEQQQALDAAKDKIAAIPSPVVYTPACKDAIDAARAAYDALTPDMLKQLVSNYATLTAAEATYENLKDVVVVEAKINEIPSPMTAENTKLSVYNKVADARAAYDALTAEQQALVSNYSRLTAAEAAFAAIGGGGMPAGALNGKFTINAGGDQIAFAKGNLQATTTDLGANWTWGFAANQWDYLGIAVANSKINGNGTVSENGTVDLFGWSTAATYYGINNSYKAVDYIGDFVDWGPNMGAGWRTLTKDEWNYLIENNTKGRATVNDKNGYIFLPDNWSGPAFTPDPDNFTTNVYSGDDWTAMENAGAVFLPSGPARNGTYALIANDAKYCSSTSLNNDSSYVFTIYYNQSQSACTGTNRAYGCMVRLVTAGGASPIADAQAAKDLIDAIGEVSYPGSKEAIKAAREAVDALGANASLLDDADLNKLTQAEAAYAQLLAL